mmetsp:Transcript_26785/g.63874  ORF Transcript_26785/g.63874 Transcript_26785/m.63874 type:complete len:502 (+) Transcript_26785:36-1541(+)
MTINTRKNKLCSWIPTLVIVIIVAVSVIVSVAVRVQAFPTTAAARARSIVLLGRRRRARNIMSSVMTSTTNETNDTKRRKVTMNTTSSSSDESSPSSSIFFRATETASEAKCLTDGVLLPTYPYEPRSGDGKEDKGSSGTTETISSIPSQPVILPWVGYGTYKLPKDRARSLTLQALQHGYRMIDTAFIYGGETIETQVGLALKDALLGRKQILNRREEVCVVTKHWRKYHGYDQTKECLRLSLKRLQLDYIDLYLIHWPGPAWSTMNRKNSEIEKHGPWHYATHSKEEMPNLRAETWRAMEDALINDQVRAIGVCNFTIKHLKELKKTARFWPPAVNQIECHPIFPQQELLDYCAQEGIVVQAYSSLGGQDAGKKFWRSIYPLEKNQKKTSTECVTSLMETPPVIELAAKSRNKTPGQILLRWALEKNLVIIPKTTSQTRMVENSNIFDFSLSKDDMDSLDRQLQQALKNAAEREEGNESIESMSRLAWRRDPLRDLDFE